MSKKKDHLDFITEKMWGSWIVEPNDIHFKRIDLSILKNGCKVSFTFASDEKEEVNFSNENYHWFGKSLLFHPAPEQYFVKDANNEYLIFGENRKSPLAGDAKWQYKFIRVS